LTDLSPSLEWNGLHGVDIGYTVEGASVPRDTTVELYWSKTDDLRFKIGGPIADASVPIPRGTMTGDHAFALTFNGDALYDPPPGAEFLVAAADPKNRVVEADKDNNTDALALPDLSTALGWFPDYRGVNLLYSISGIDLPQSEGAFTLDWYSAAGQDLGNAALVLAGHQVQDSVLSLDAKTLGTPPVGAAFLVAKADPFRDVVESDKRNNQVQLAIPQLAVRAAWHTPSTGSVALDVTTTISNDPAPVATEVAVYWASGTKLSKVLEPINHPLWSQAIPAGTLGTSGLLHVSYAALGAAPRGATHLLIVLDPARTFIAEDSASVVALPLPPLNVSVTRGGLVHRPNTNLYAQTLTFTNNGLDLASPPEVVVHGLPAGDSLASASYINPVTGQLTKLSVGKNGAGAPVLVIPPSLLASLKHGQSFKLSLTFRLTSSQPFSFTPDVLEGPF
jgi:hypothetical protein